MRTKAGGDQVSRYARLAIAIPAYGRASAIANSINCMSNVARQEELDVVFHVSDDTPDTSVRDALQPLIDAGIPLSYQANIPPLRHDNNLIATLLAPNADYVWLLGSSHTVKPEVFGRVYHFLKEQDLVFVNNHFPDMEFASVLSGGEALRCLRDRLWHQTLTGVTIYGSRVRDWVKFSGETLRIFPDFPQISVMLGYASHRDVTVGVFGEVSLQSSGSEIPSYWRDRAVDVFVYHWSAVVYAFPKILPPHLRSRAIREHSARTDLFNTTNLIHYRQTGQFSWDSIKNRQFREAMHLPLWKLLVILVAPIPFLKAGGRVLAYTKQMIGRA